MPSCVTRMMGPALSDPERSSVHEKMLSIFEKAGYEVIYPEVSPSRRPCCASSGASLAMMQSARGLQADCETFFCKAGESAPRDELPKKLARKI